MYDAKEKPIPDPFTNLRLVFFHPKRSHLVKQTYSATRLGQRVESFTQTSYCVVIASEHVIMSLVQYSTDKIMVEDRKNGMQSNWIGSKRSESDREKTCSNQRRMEKKKIHETWIGFVLLYFICLHPWDSIDLKWNKCSCFCFLLLSFRKEKACENSWVRRNETVCCCAVYQCIWFETKVKAWMSKL